LSKGSFRHTYLGIEQWRNWPVFFFAGFDLFYRVEVTTIGYPAVFTQEFFTQVRLIAVELAQVISGSHTSATLATDTRKAVPTRVPQSVAKLFFESRRGSAAAVWV